MRPTSASSVRLWISATARFTVMPSVPAMKTVPSFSISILTSRRSCKERMVLPPGPIRRPILSVSILIVTIRGAESLSCLRGSAIASSITSKICKRATRACSNAFVNTSSVTPSILISICKAVIPLRVPATLKSISPR